VLTSFRTANRFGLEQKFGASETCSAFITGECLWWQKGSATRIFEQLLETDVSTRQKKMQFSFEKEFFLLTPEKKPALFCIIYLFSTLKFTHDNNTSQSKILCKPEYKVRFLSEIAAQKISGRLKCETLWRFAVAHQGPVLPYLTATNKTCKGTVLSLR